MAIYKHTQMGTLVLVVLGLGIALTVSILFMVQTDSERILVAAVTGLLLLCIFLFRTLNVSVDSEKVEVSFGPGAFRKRFLVADINSARAVGNSWYFGWGIRWIPNGWMYNVSGFDSVELDLKDNRKFRIGTDDPDNLLAAIQENTST